MALQFYDLYSKKYNFKPFVKLEAQKRQFKIKYSRKNFMQECCKQLDRNCDFFGQSWDYEDNLLKKKGIRLQNVCINNINFLIKKRFTETNDVLSPLG